MHAYDLIENAKIFSSFEDTIKKIDFLVATSSIESKNEKRHLRNAISLENLSENLIEIEGKVGLVFGREDYGLFNEEIASCDALLRIPTSESYLSLNLSHAVALVLYSLYINRKSEPKQTITIGKIEKEKLYNFFSQILEEINYPSHKKENTEIMFKRIMGRAIPSKWEYHTLMGVFSKTLEKLKNKKD
jgi:TrmH family RNA methyltransferase